MSSPKFDQLLKNAKKVTKKAANRTMELADIASLNIKLQGQQVKLSEKYERLGRLAYSKLADSADNAEKIASVMSEIETLITSVKDIKAEIKVKKQMQAANRKKENSDNE